MVRQKQAAGRVQIEDLKETGYFVAPGFSGGPVWEDEAQRVVGMIVGADRRPEIRAAYMLPAARLLDVLGVPMDEQVLAAGDDNDLAPEPVPLVPPFIGRESELEEYGKRLRKDRLVFIGGQAGVGKTTFGARLAGEAALEAAQIFWFTFDEVEKGTADAFFWTLAAFLRTHGATRLWQYLRHHDEARAGMVTNARVDRLLRDLTSVDLVLCLGDVHLVRSNRDIEYFFRVLRTRFVGRRAELPARFIVIGRDVPPAMADLAGEPLGGFSPEEARRFLAECRGIELPASLLAELHGRTGGIAHLLDLSASTLALMMGDTDAIARFLADMAGRGNVHNYVAREMYGALPHPERLIVGALAILERPVERQLLETILPEREIDQIHDRVEALLGKRVIVEPSAGYLVCPSPMREHALHALASADRAELQRRAAEYFGQRRNYLGAARLHVQSRAVELLSTHAGFIINTGGAAGLLDQLRKLDWGMLTGDQRRALNGARGDAHRMRGEYKLALDAYRLALGATTGKVEQAQMLCKIGQLHELLREPDRALGYFQQALELAEAVEDVALAASAHRLIGLANYRLARHGEAGRHYSLAMTAAKEQGDESLLARAHDGLGLVALAGDRFAEARDHLEQSVASYQQLGDRDMEARATGNLALVHGRKGETREQNALYEKVESILQEVGDVDGLCRLYNNAGYFWCHRLPDFAKAVSFYERLADLAGSIEHWGFLILAHAGLADAFRGLGHLDRALASARAARRVATGRGSASDLALAERVLGDVWLARGDPTRAYVALRASIRLLRGGDEAAASELALAQRSLAQARILRVGAGPLGRTRYLLLLLAERLPNVDRSGGARGTDRGR